MNLSQWPHLQERIKAQELEWIDFYFAKRWLKEDAKEEIAEVLANLMASTREGHLCLILNDQVVIPEDLIGDGKPLYLNKNRLYLQRNWQLERSFEAQISRLLSAPSKEVNAQENPELNAEQNEALRKALKYPLSLITGGPGTGKSFTAAHIVNAFKGAKIFLAAPTGKAAALLAKSIPHVPATTLHRLLNVPLDADLIIVDEASMMDAKIFVQFLSSIQAGTQVVLMGDPHQLPPVEAGSFFADLVKSDRVLQTELTQSRRTDRKEILELSQSILQGDESALLNIAKKRFLTSEDLYNYVKNEFPCGFLEMPDPEELLQRMDQFRILSCLRKGEMGSDYLNQLFFSLFFREKRAMPYFCAPLMATKNEENLSNGETGVRINDLAYFPGKKPIPFKALCHVEYAYVLSVHKAQGSEYGKVLLLVPAGSESFGKEILYTGVTRARQSVEIEADCATLQAMMRKDSKKISGLGDL